MASIGHTEEFRKWRKSWLDRPLGNYNIKDMQDAFEGGFDLAISEAKRMGLNNFWRIINGLEPLQDENPNR